MLSFELKSRDAEATLTPDNVRNHGITQSFGQSRKGNDKTVLDKLRSGPYHDALVALVS
jgi:hypothetical protein